LSIILELAPNAQLNQNYSATKFNDFVVNLEFKLDKLPNSAVKEVSKLNKYVIMIDPGHGGKDYGTMGLKQQRSEKDLALIYAKELDLELSKYPQYQVLLTRDKDIYMSPKYRKQKVHQAKADLFISLHVDSNANPEVRGSSIYTLSKQAMDQESLLLSQRENKDDILQNE